LLDADQEGGRTQGRERVEKSLISASQPGRK
jgi:hypothetical protein